MNGITKDAPATKPIPMPRPVVTLGYAQTLDGRLATSTGSSRWISAHESLRFSHELRAEHDAIMVGAGTVCTDDPRLTVRLAAGRNPLRVVVDSTLRTPLTAAVLTEGAAPGTVFAVTDRVSAAKRDKVRALGATVQCLPTDAGGRVGLIALLAALHKMGIGSVLVEGGAQMITALLQVRLVDRLVVCVAPKILGSGIEAVGDLGISELAGAMIVTDTSITPYGPDLVFDGRVEYPITPAMAVESEERAGCVTA
jgi:5-amino-6-(5-phosphoribosylamino)uracil reductase/diaminohydroxyphosphoribosylaminopyrimidine deaminase/5-amino-6-(5-phosphoribosylamino)uracil reductase